MEAMENAGIKLVCLNYKRSDCGDKLKQKLLRKLNKAFDKRQISGIKNVPEVETESVLQVAFNVNYMILLLKDGRVCRVHCPGNSDITENANSYEPGRESFQVSSDLEYARVLQRQYDSEQSFATAMEQEYNYIGRLNDSLSSPLYDPLLHVDHPSSFAIPTFDATPVEEEMATISSPFRARRHYNSPARGYGGFDSSRRKAALPEFGALEWLTLKQGAISDGGTSNDSGFVAMAALHSEILLVDRSAQQLYSWPCKQAITMAMPHPFTTELGLQGERIAQLVSSNVRTTVVTESGKIATFYDTILRNAGNNKSPSLIGLLTHSCQQLLPPGETVKGMAVADFYSAVMTDSGRVYWWGLAPQDGSSSKGLVPSPVNLAAEKQQKLTVGSRVSLNNGPKYGINMPVLQSSVTMGPRIGYTVDIEEHSILDPKVSVLVKVTTDHHHDTETEKCPSSIGISSSRQQSGKNSLEVWSRSEVVFLDNPTAPFGEIMAIDQQQAVVRLEGCETDKLAVKILKLSELEAAPLNSTSNAIDDSLPLHHNVAASCSTKASPYTKHSAGIIQHKPLCILDASCQWKPSEPINMLDLQPGSMVTGFRPITIQATKDGVMLLVERISDSKTFLMFPAAMTTSLVRGSSYIATGNCANHPNKCTLEECAVDSVEAGFVCNDETLINGFNCEGNTYLPNGSVILGEKRKHSGSGHGNDGKNLTELVSVKPQLLTCMDSRLLMLKNAYGTVSLLSEGSLIIPSVDGIHDDHVIAHPISNIVVSHRAVTKETNCLIVAIVPRVQQFLPAIQRGDMATVLRVMTQLSSSPVGTTGKGKGLAGKPGVGKKIKLDSDKSTTASHDPDGDHMTSGDVGHHILLERGTNNNNILHVCCSMATSKVCVEEVSKQSEFSSVEVDGDKYQCITMKEDLKNFSLEELRYKDQKDTTGTSCSGIISNKEPTKRQLSLCERQLEILDILLKCSSVRSTVNYLLCSRNQYGYTPFLHAIFQRNYSAALKIIKHVSSLVNSSDDPMGETLQGALPPSFFFCAILAPCSKGLSPLHAFFASASGVYDSQQMCLHVSGLPSGFTAQQLLKHFQVQFSSAYRAEVFQETANGTSDSEEDEDGKGCDHNDVPEHESLSAFHAPRSRYLLSPPLRDPGDSIVFPEAAPLLTAAEVRRFRDRTSRRHRSPRYTTSRILTQISGTGFVFFSDIHQLRAALAELDNTSVNTASHAPGGGPFFGSSTTAHVGGRISVRLAGDGTGDSSDLAEFDSDKEDKDTGVRDKERDEGQRATATVDSAFSDLKKLHDIIEASKRTSSPTVDQPSITIATNAEQRGALRLFNKLMEYPEVMTAQDAGRETAVASLVHNPFCLKALKMFFSCKSNRSAPSKLPRSNPYRMMSSLKATRGRSRRHHHVTNKVGSQTASVSANEASSVSIVKPRHSELVVPSLNLSSNISAVNSMVDELVRKQISDELFKDATTKQPVTSSENPTTPADIADIFGSIGKPVGDVSRDSIMEAIPLNKPDKHTGHPSPMFPNLSEEAVRPSGRDEKSKHGGFINILLNLTRNWSSIVTTILGNCLPMQPGEGSSGSENYAKVERSSHSCDYFIQDLIYNCGYTVSESLADTILCKLNEGFVAGAWTLDDVLLLEDECTTINETNIALIVGKKFLHSLVRLLAIQLSDSVVEGEGESTERASKNKNVIGSIQKLLAKFTWLAVKCVADAAAATSMPVCLGVCKPMLAASVSSDYNFVHSSAVRHGMAMGIPSLERTQQAMSSQRKRVYIKQCFMFMESEPKAALPQDGLRMIPSCGQEGIEEMNSFETDPTPQEMDDPSSQTAIDEDSHLYNMPIVQSPVQHLQEPSLDIRYHSNSITHSLMEPLLASPTIAGDDTESSLDDEEEYTMLINQGVLRPDSADTSSGEYIRIIPPVDDSRRGGDEAAEDHEDVYPFAWALDGRNINDNATTSHIRPTTPLFGIQSESIGHMLYNAPSIRFGAGFLARTFCRLTKDMVDLAVDITSTQYVSPEHRSATKEREVVSLILPEAIKDELVAASVALLQPTWLWLVKVLDVAQGQLEEGQLFDTTSYVMSLKAHSNQSQAGTSRPFYSSSVGGWGYTGSSPADYLTYLLRSHTGEQRNCLPVIDLVGYEHVVYLLDAMMYSLSKWPKESTAHPPTGPTVTEAASGNHTDTTASSPTGTQRSTQPSTAMPNSTISRFFQRTQSITLNYGNGVGDDTDMASNSFERSIVEEIPLAQQPHLLEPFLKKEEQAAAVASRRQSSSHKLPLSYSRISNRSEEDQQPIVLSWSVEGVLQRWKTVIKVFAHIFLAEGPGNERDNFLNPHAGFASRMARFRHKVAHILETNAMRSYRTWSSVSMGDSQVLTIRARRSHLLQDSLQLLASLGRMHYSQVRVKFEGEDGSGPGVNRGFFASFAAALKNPTKEAVKVGQLLHEPGKKPEQSGLYSPSPVESCSGSRVSHFRAIGRFLGLALLFRYNVPIMLCRHVAKYLIGRELSWHDVAFYNADLYEGLRRMIRDVESEKNSAEDFKATYCCYFEASHCGRVIDLIPGGSRIAVTPDRVHEYVHLYAMYRMVGCVQKELDSMRDGLHDVIPTQLLCGLAAEDFQLLLCGGSANITIKRLKSIIRFQHTYTHPHSRNAIRRFERMFWKLVGQMNNKQRQQLLYFATGSAGIPTSSESESGLTISVDVISSGNTESLPVASTCGQRMSIPLYPTYHTLKKKLLQAIQCQAYGLS